jgi:hypothetical protein
MNVINEQLNQIEKNRSRLAEPEKSADQIVVHKMPSSAKIDNHSFITGSINATENKHVRTTPEKTKFLGLIIIIVGILVIAALAYFGYRYFSQEAKVDNNVEVPLTTEDQNSELEFTLPVENEPITSSSSEVIAEVATSTPETPPTEEPTRPVSIKDSDADGLFDVEEYLLGSDITSTDSDSDSFQDYAETFGLYNPAGNGKLETSSMISEYRSPSYNFSVLYPASWSVGSTSDNSSVVFKINSSSFVQIIVEPNTEKEEIAAWYQRQFPSDLVSGERLAKLGTLDGIKSSDDLIVYATDVAKENIFIVSYVPENENMLEYYNIFLVILKSFSLF